MSPTFNRALRAARLLDDGEIKELHREVSRLARAAYGRSEDYQGRYRMGMQFAQPKIEAWQRPMRERFAKQPLDVRGATTLGSPHPPTS